MKIRKPTSIVLLALTLSIVCAGVTAVYAGVIEQPPAAQPVPLKIEIADGPFKPSWESLKQYKCPEWFRDAKLGIWAHWGPQAVPMDGDWYARAMYEQGQDHYNYHVANYGHPSVFGYKDLVQLWKAEKWDPDRLVGLYKKAGARYFVAMANHHDNWDNWNSKYHRWNAVKVGPKKDVVGLWAAAARKHGLRFGVTEHVARSYSWFNTNKGSDKEGPLAGVPYDGNDPAFQDLYFPPHDDISYAYPANPPEWWPRQWFWRIRDLIDTYQPDLLYTDGAVPFGEVGRSVFAHYYNANVARNGGKLEAVYNLKDMAPRTDHGEYVDGIGVQDVERGVLGGIKAEPWQTDTCIGNWFYKTGFPYKSASQVICMLCDIVSKNGNLLLSIPLKPDGTLDAAEEKVLAAMGAWMDVNGEAIYGTRPWKVFGEGRSQDGGEDGRHYSDRDIRFTSKGDALYALVLGWPDGQKTLVRSLASGAGTITNVSLLGYSGELKWKQTSDGLEVVLPSERPSEHAFALKIIGRQLQPVPISPAVAHYDPHGRIVLEARDAKIHGDTPRYELDGAKDQIGFWSNPKDYVSWTFEVLKTGTYNVAVTYSCSPGSEGSDFLIEVAGQTLTRKSRATASWSTYLTDNAGSLTFGTTGVCTLAVKPGPAPKWGTIGLQSVILTPAVTRATSAKPTARARSGIAPLVAIAKPNLTVAVGKKVALDAQYSRVPTNAPVAYTWRQEAGPTVRLADANISKATFTPEKAGKYVFNLTVKADTRTSEDKITVDAVVPDSLKLKNGQFDSTLDGWNLSVSSIHVGTWREGKIEGCAAPAMRGVVVDRDPKGGMGGTGALRIRIDKPQNGADADIYQDLQLEPYRVYVLRGLVRGENVQQGKGDGHWEPAQYGPSLAANYCQAESIRGPSNEKLKGTFDWTPVELDFPTGAEGRLRILLKAGHGGGAGTVWFDNLTIEPDPQIVTVERPHFVRHFWKTHYDKLAPGQAAEYVDEMGAYWKAVTELTGHYPDDFTKFSMFVPQRWNVWGGGALSVNPILITHAHENWTPGKLRQEFKEVGILHELCHMVTTGGMGLWGEMGPCVFFMYPIQTMKLGGENLPEVSVAFKHCYKDEWIDKKEIGEGSIDFRWTQIADKAGWDSLKRLWRMAVVTVMPDSASARLWQAGYDYPVPTQVYLDALKAGGDNRWPVIKALMDILAEDSGYDVWSLFQPGEIEAYQKYLNYR